MWVVQCQRKEPQEFLIQSGLGYCLSHMVSEKLKNSWMRDQNRGKHSEECEKRCQVLDDA